MDVQTPSWIVDRAHNVIEVFVSALRVGVHEFLPALELPPVAYPTAWYLEMTAHQEEPGTLGKVVSSALLCARAIQSGHVTACRPLPIVPVSLACLRSECADIGVCVRVVADYRIDFDDVMWRIDVARITPCVENT